MSGALHDPTRTPLFASDGSRASGGSSASSPPDADGAGRRSDGDGAGRRSGPPLLSSEQATKLLDDLIYERVLSFIDLDGLFGFEQELWCAYEELGPIGDHVAVAVKTMIDRALVRLCEDPRRYMTFGEPYGGTPLGSSPLGSSPFGRSPLSTSRLGMSPRGTSPLDVIPYGNELFADCELCEQEARELREDDARAARSAKRRRTG